MRTTSKTARWSANRQVAAGINWVTPNIVGNGPDKKPIKHTLEMGVNSVDTVVSIHLTSKGLTKIFSLNDGLPLIAGVGYQFDILLEPGDSYNLQHSTGTQNPFLKVFESTDLEV